MIRKYKVDICQSNWFSKNGNLPSMKNFGIFMAYTQKEALNRAKACGCKLNSEKVELIGKGTPNEFYQSKCVISPKSKWY